MNYHAGVLDPEGSTLRWIHSVGSLANLPDPVANDLRITLQTPGFPHGFWPYHLQRTKGNLVQFLNRFEPDYRSALENWDSVTREDAIKLCHMAPNARPTVCYMHIVNDYKAGMTHAQIAKEYGVSIDTVWRKCTGEGPLMRAAYLPQWFRDRIPGI
jgi:hypothetical protein